MSMPPALRYLHYTGFGLSEIFNIYLFSLILTKSSKKFGAYKYLMATFTVFSMVYGVVEVLTQPVMHIEGHALIVYVDSFLRYDKTIGFVMIALYCSSFGVCVLLLSTHFCYRYLAVCRTQMLRKFSGKRIFAFFCPALVFGLIWFITVVICERPTDFNSEYLKESLKLLYDEDSYAVAQLSAVYYYYDQKGDLVIHWAQCISIVILYSIMGTSIASMLYFSLKTYKAIQGHTKMSPTTRDLHYQLFYTLVLQSLVPFVTLFVPVGLLFLMPMFNVNLGYLTNTPGAWISFYPAIDAAIMILMIRNFRNALFCRKHKSPARITTAFDPVTNTNLRRLS